MCRPDEPHCFSGDQLPRLARATRASELGSPLPIVAAGTGLRPEEWLGIARRDVDRVRGVLHVRHVDVDGQVKLTGRRPGSVPRLVPLTTRVVAALNDIPLARPTAPHRESVASQAFGPITSPR